MTSVQQWQNANDRIGTENPFGMDTFRFAVSTGFYFVK